MKVKLDNDAIIPTRAHDTDAGYDLCSRVDCVIAPHSSEVLDTGVHIQLPPGTCGLVVSKSGLNTHHNITSTGLIDEGYTGEIKIKLYNHGDYPYYIYKGDKISQFVILDYHKEDIEIVEELEKTDRGDNGFGSTSC